MKHPTDGTERRVGVVGCKHTTQDLILGLRRHGYDVDHCITIAPGKAEEQQVAGYLDLAPFLADLGVPCTVASTYALTRATDKERLLALELDAVLVMGWQRLIPDWFLASLSIGAFGMHGSSKPLPHGRGRSPMNWSLIQGKDRFYTHLFRYAPGVDDGPIVGVQTFDINPYDTCLTLHHKNTIAMVRLCAQHLPALLDGSAHPTPQPAAAASYYPKRSADDGLIYWQDTTAQIHNLVRAVTMPFPGAFAYLDNDVERPVRIWRAQPFDTQLTYGSARPGEIVEVFSDGAFVVRTGDGSLLVTETDAAAITGQDLGRILGTAETPRTHWDNLPD